jgi:hypothetical protein
VINLVKYEPEWRVMNDIFRLECDSYDALKVGVAGRLQEMGRPVPQTKQAWDEFFAFLDVLEKQQAVTIVNASNASGPRPKDAYGLFVPKTRIHINVKRASIAAAALAVDILLTKGLATVLLTMSGHMKQSLTNLQTDNGQFCSAVAFASLGPMERPVDQLLEELSAKPCKQPDLNCKFNCEGQCTINEAAAEKNLSTLVEEGVIETANGIWAVTR